MSTITDIRKAIQQRIRVKTKPNTVTAGDVADNLDLLADEVRTRGLIKCRNTGELSTISGSNAQSTFVISDGVFIYDPTVTADNANSFSALGTGAWVRVGSLGAPVRLQINSDNPYEIVAGYTIDKIIISPQSTSNIKIGTTPGGDELMLETSITGGEAYALRTDVVAKSANKTIYISGIISTTNITIYLQKY